MANDYGTTPQQSGFKTIWEALRGMNEGRLATNEEFNRAGGRNIDVLKNRANVGTPPFVPPGQKAPAWHPPMAMPKPPSPMDTLRAQQNPAHPVTPPVPPAAATSSVAATGPGAAASPAGGSKESVPAPADPTSEYANIYDELGPEGIEAILGGQALEEQKQTAMALRDKESPQGRYVSNGRIYTAASPIEHIASGYGKYKGAKDTKRIQGEQADMRKTVIDLLRNKGIVPDQEDPQGWR